MELLKKNIAIILASGLGKRFDSKEPKQYLDFNRDLLINQTTQLFLNHKKIDLILVMVNKKHKKFFNKILKNKKVLLSYGGETRQKSVFLGLKEIEKYKPKNVLIHDASRPIVKAQLITKIIEKLYQNNAVVPKIKIQETIKHIKNNIPSNIKRNNAFIIQTPQGFKYKYLYNFHKKNLKKEFTDDSSLFEKEGRKISFINGDKDNIKITDKNDLKLAEKLYYSKNKLSYIGLGIDFHRFNDKKGKLILCGVKIPFNKTLIAHSDGDLGYHAISDGILGAISEGDIGIHFPDSSKKNKNLNSAKILKYSYELMKKKINGEIKNIDLTFIGEEPKFSKYQKKMRLNISKLLNLDLNQINIKATTTEKMGPLGSKEGLGAFALVNII